jgi:hypothetical protein
LTGGLEDALFAFGGGLIGLERLLARTKILDIVCATYSFRIRVQVSDNVLQVLVVRVWLEAQFVLERHGKGNDHVEAADLAKQILFTHHRVIMSFLSMDPDQACEVLRHESKLCPVLAALAVALIGCRGAETKRETNNETEDGEEELVDADLYY